MAYNNIFPTAVDLFCGAGGLSLGLENANINVALGVELNKVALDTYQHNLPGNVLENDIHNVTGEDILNLIHLETNQLFLLAGCPPCQTFSSLQKDDVTNDERNNLIFEYVRLINEIQPLFILMENVPGLMRGRGRNIFSNAIQQLQPLYELNYNVLNCANYGVPQTRSRLVLHGIRRDAYNLLVEHNQNFKVSLPIATHTQNPDLHPDLLPWRTAGEVFTGLPSIIAGKDAPIEYPNHETNRLADINIQRIQYIRTHGGSRDCLPEGLRLPCHKAEKVGYTGVYGIINVCQPAPTITSGCISFSKGRYGHPNEDRAISVREAARFQSFPDDFIFSGTRNQKALQVGNAVPPLLAQASGSYFISLLNQLHDIKL